MKMMIKKYGAAFLISILLGLIIAFIHPGEKPLIGWLGSTFISLIFSVGIQFIFRKLQTPTKVRTITIVNFLLRLSIGILLFLFLPIFGYEEEPPQAGYLYLDAFRRDADAWQIASTDEPILAGFGDEFYTDQYGGMLSMSAAVYRFLSPDAHRPTLILLITAFISSLGIPFYWQVLNNRFGGKVANLATWILALYPESVFLGASQMREPLIIGISGILWWGLHQIKKNKKIGIILSIASLALLTVISTRYAIIIFLLVLLWLWNEYTPEDVSKKKKLLRAIPLGLIIVIGLFISWKWLVDTARWDLYLMESSSGRVQFELDNIGQQYRIPFLVLYGVLQPVLPAAIAYPGIPIMSTIAIVRAAGWYLVAPALLLAPFFVFKEKDGKNRKMLLLSIAFILFWVLLSSLRAGGDQWDNPRYRTAMLPWMALAIGWTTTTIKKSNSPWLKRLYSIVIVFCAFFLQWYLSRYYKLGSRLPFVQMIVALALVMLCMLIGFFIYDHFRKQKQGSSNSK